MDFVEILLIAVGLAMDASAVSLVAAASGYAKDPHARFRLSFHFGLFQFFMPIIGWILGQGLVSYITAVDHWVAFGLLTFVGVKMIWSGIRQVEQYHGNDPSRGLTLVILSVATSIDALAIGLSLAVLSVNIWYPSVIIGVTTAGLSLLAIRVGQRLGITFGQRMEIMGGIILIILGCRILWTQFI